MRWHPGGLEDDVRLPEVGDLRQAGQRWGSWGLPGPRDHDLRVLDRLGPAAGAAEVRDGDQDVFLDESQRLEGQDTLHIQGVGRLKRLGDVSVAQIAEPGGDETHGEQEGTGEGVGPRLVCGSERPEQGG